MTANHFAYKLIPPRPTFAADMSDGERAVMAEHAGYWTTLFERGQVAVFGAVLEPAGVWGLAVVEADSVEAVRAMAADDPAVRTQTCSFEIGTMLPGTLVRPAAAGEAATRHVTGGQSGNGELGAGAVDDAPDGDVADEQHPVRGPEHSEAGGPHMGG